MHSLGVSMGRGGRQWQEQAGGGSESGAVVVGVSSGGGREVGVQ